MSEICSPVLGSPACLAVLLCLLSHSGACWCVCVCVCARPPLIDKSFARQRLQARMHVRRFSVIYCSSQKVILVWISPPSSYPTASSVRRRPKQRVRVRVRASMCARKHARASAHARAHARARARARVRARACASICISAQEYMLIMQH